MIRRPPRSTRTDTLFPDTTLFRSIGNVGFAFPALQVIDAGQPDRATVQLGFAHGAHERGISTVTRAIDAEPLGIRVALRNRPARSIADVVDHPRVPSVPALLLERLRSEERRFGKRWVSQCRSRWSPYT